MAEVRKDSKGRKLRPGECEREDGRYAYSYTLYGKRRWIYDRDLAELRKKAKAIERDKDDGIRTQDASRVSLNDVHKCYMATKHDLKITTRSNYEYLWNKYVAPTDLASKPIGNIKKSDIKKLYISLLNHGFAIRSLDGINNLVHPTLEMAVDDDLIRKNPSKGVYRELKKNSEVKCRKALTLEQQRAFLNYIINSPVYYHWATVFVTLLGTGLRVGECLGLTKSDISFDENLISVNHSLVYRQIDGKCQFLITSPKTKSGSRFVPMLADVFNYLKAHFEIMDELYDNPSPTLQGYTDFVFRGRTGKLLSPHSLNRAIERISRDYNQAEIEAAKLESREPLLLPHFSVHILRHTFCTRLFEKEEDHKNIQTIMGHAEVSTTLDIYTHITTEHLKARVQKLNADISLF